MKNSKYTQPLSEESCVLKDVADSPDSILKIITLERGQNLKCVYKHYSMLVFIVSGRINITSVCAKNEYIGLGEEMLFIPQGRTYYLEAALHSELMFCNVPPIIELFHKNPLDIYAKYINKIPESLSSSEIFKLPIHPILFEEIEHVVKVFPHFVNSHYFQNHKRDTFIIYARNLYAPEEIAYFIRTMIGEDMKFLSLVMDIYHQDITTQEFIEQSGMSESTFNRKFKKAFDMTLGHWLINKKREEIVEDLALTDLSIHDIAQKHFLTPNHLAKFSHSHYGMSPTELRKRLRMRRIHLANNEE